MWIAHSRKDDCMTNDEEMNKELEANYEAAKKLLDYLERMYPSEETSDDETIAFYKMKYTIGFNGVQIELNNYACLYEDICSALKELMRRV